MLAGIVLIVGWSARSHAGSGARCGAGTGRRGSAGVDFLLGPSRDRLVGLKNSSSKFANHLAWPLGLVWLAEMLMLCVRSLMLRIAYIASISEGGECSGSRICLWLCGDLSGTRGTRGRYLYL